VSIASDGGAAESSDEAVWEIPPYNLAMNTTIQTQSDRCCISLGAAGY